MAVNTKASRALQHTRNTQKQTSSAASTAMHTRRASERTQPEMKRKPEDISRVMRADPRCGGKQYPADTEQDVNPAASVITRLLRSGRAAVLACTDSPIYSAVYYTADLTALLPLALSLARG